MPDLEQQSVAPRRGGRLASGALTVAAVLGTLCIVFALCASVFSLTPLVFRSGSMDPAIPTGSLALARETPAVDARVGDVVSVLRSDGSRITHRVDRVDFSESETAVLILKGDANSQADVDPYIVSSVDRIVAHVPYAGYAASWLSTPFAWVVGGAMGLALLYVAVWPSRLRDTRPRQDQPPSSGRHRSHAAVATALVALVVVPAFGATRGTEAALTDSARAQAVPTAATMVRPASFTCTTTGTGSNRVANLSWPAVDPLYGYRVVFTPTGLLGGSTQTVDVQPGTPTTAVPPGSGFLIQNYRATLVSRVGNFVSTPALTRDLSIIGLGSNVTSSCDTSGTTSGPAAAAPLAAARVAPTTTTTASEAPATTTPAPTTTAPTSTTGVTTTTSTPPPPAPTTTTAPPPPSPVTTSTTPPPPPASAFVADGGSATSGTTTASVSGSTLTLTGADGTSVYSRALTSSARYGTGVVFSSTGDLYVLADAGVSRIVVANGVATESAVSTAELPADISALL